MFGIGFVWYTYPYLDIAFSKQDQGRLVNSPSEPAKKHENFTI
jgi:hypothetical protein